MHTVWIVVVVASAGVRPAAAEPPFAPIADVPDYVVTMTTRDHRSESVSTVRHHGNWTRIDREDGTHRVSEYVSLDGLAHIHVYDSGSHMSFIRGRPPQLHFDIDARKTAQRKT
jgi:hypothetical protein